MVQEPFVVTICLAPRIEHTGGETSDGSHTTATMMTEGLSCDNLDARTTDKVLQHECTTVESSTIGMRTNVSSRRRLLSIAFFLSSSGCLAFSPASLPYTTSCHYRPRGRPPSQRKAWKGDSLPRSLADYIKKDRFPEEGVEEGQLGDDTNAGGPAKASWLKWMLSGRPKDVDHEKASWMSWMISGQPRGVAEVKMREALELGGVPRNDRYSSRYRPLFITLVFCC